MPIKEQYQPLSRQAQLYLDPILQSTSIPMQQALQQVKQQPSMQKDSRNRKVNGGAALARYLAIFLQKSNWKEKPECHISS